MREKDYVDRAPDGGRYPSVIIYDRGLKGVGTLIYFKTYINKTNKEMFVYNTKRKYMESVFITKSNKERFRALAWNLLNQLRIEVTKVLEL